MNIDEFLGHSNRARGRSRMLSGWKDSDSHSVVVWLHTMAPFVALYRHNWYKVQAREDRQTRVTTREVWSDRLVCYENEEVLKRQDWRDRDTGVRDLPPQVCPHCKMIEHVRGMVVRGELPWTEPVFRFAGDDPAKTVWLHAGGLYNAFGARELSVEQKQQMATCPRDKGGPIFAKTAFKENQKAKLEYVFTVVNDARPEDGIQVAIESNLLGQKVQDLIAKSMKELGREDGNPMLKPYAIQFEYNPADGIEFSKRYDAIRMSRIALRPAVEQLIRRTNPPPLTEIVHRFNVESLRANMERHALVKLPLDLFFEEARKRVKAPAAQVPASYPGADQGFTGGAEATPPPMTPPEQPASHPHRQEPAAEQLFGCDDCGHPMRATDPRCGKCGKVYEVMPADSPPPPALPKRSAAAPGPTNVSPQSTSAGDDFYPADDAQEDDIPFISAADRSVPRHVRRLSRWQRW